MKPGFLESHLDTRSSNGRDDTLLSELHFRDINGNFYRVPKGATTDGGSIPWYAQWIPGFQPLGTHWLEWVLHDSAYRGTLQIRQGCDYELASITRAQADELLVRALGLRGMGPIRRRIVHRSLWAFGGKNFKAKRA